MEAKVEEGILEGEAKKKGFSIVDIIQEEVPDHLHSWPYTLGAIPLVLFLVLAATGILMTFYYIPHPDRAYDSVWNITNGVYLGWFIRGVHKFTVHLMVLTLFLHMIRVFITRAYKTPGEIKWLVGSLGFFTVLGMGFTGYALIYDNVSYWGSVVVTNMMAAIPVIGKPLLYLLRGGEEITELTLLRLYDLHTKLLPLTLVVLIAGHIAATRVIGFAKVEGANNKTHPFYPGHALKVVIIALGLLIFIVNMVIIFPPTLGPPANPLEVASDVSPPWYFSATYKWITIVPRQLGLSGILAFMGLFLIYPYIDRSLSRNGWNMGKVNMVVGGVAIVAFVGLTLWEIMG